MLGGSYSTGSVVRFTVRITVKALLSASYSDYQIKLSNLISYLRDIENKTFKAISEIVIKDGYKSPRGFELIPESVFSIYKKRKIRDKRLNSPAKEEVTRVEVIDLYTGDFEEF